MNLSQLGKYLELKYSLASETSHAETYIRNAIDSLWQVPNKTFNILRACADTGASAPKNVQEEHAIKGFQFCQQVVGIIDYLKVHRNTISLGQLRKALSELLELIKTNIEGDHVSLQFPHVSELIFQMMPYGKKHDRKIRDQEYAKARKGLSRITSISLSIINEINKLGGAVEQEGRFDPQGSKLSESEITNFLRQYGQSYGIPDWSTWHLVLHADPSLETNLTRLVHSLLRGNSPNVEPIKSKVQEILARQPEPENTSMFEQNNPAPAVSLFDDQGAMDKLAWKYLLRGELT